MSSKVFQPIKEGKVREVYDNGDSLIIVATDRISAFDHILKNKVTKKGAILTQMSKFWFDLTKDIVPNHMISVDVKDMPEFFQEERFDGNSMMCKKLEMLPIECIVRGYITGSGWESYKENGTVCGNIGNNDTVFFGSSRIDNVVSGSQYTDIFQFGQGSHVVCIDDYLVSQNYFCTG